MKDTTRYMSFKIIKLMKKVFIPLNMVNQNEIDNLIIFRYDLL